MTLHGQNIELDAGIGFKVIKSQEEKAKKVLALAKQKNADFAELAKEYSEGPAAPSGGELGYFSHARMIPAFSTPVFAAKVNDIIGPIRTEFGFHVIFKNDADA